MYYNSIPIGGDWGLPVSSLQLAKLEEISSHAFGLNWLFSAQQITLFPAYALWRLVACIGYDAAFIALLLLVFTASLVGMGLLLRHLRGENIGLILGGLFFVFSALTFDYLLMGWDYALIALSLLPLCLWAFIRGLEGSFLLLLFAGVLFALSPLQSQAMIWYFLCFMAVAVSHLFAHRSYWQVAKALAVVLLIFVLGNAYWLPSLFLYPPSYVANSNIIESAISVGTMTNYNLLNAIRIWGSLYNYQFETVQMSAGVPFFSFLVPALAAVGLWRARSPYKWAFAFLMLSPLPLLFLGTHRWLLAALPFANAFRDIPRFSVWSLLGTSVLAGLGAGIVYQWAEESWGRFGRVVSLLCLAIGLLGVTYPWWSGDVTNWQACKGRDIRLRFKQFPESYFRLESRLADERLEQKAMYYPLGGTVALLDDSRFQGGYREMQDVFAWLSPVPGIVAISDRKFGVIDEWVDRLAHDDPDRSQLRMLSDAGVRLFIFRRNMTGPYPTPGASLVREMVASGEWSLWFEDKEVVAYAAKHFNPVVSAVSLGKGVAGRDLSSTVFYKMNQSPDQRHIQIERKISDTGEPTVEFRKIDPTLYRVRIHDIHGSFTLVFNETYNDHWRLGLAAPLQSGTLHLTSSVNLARADGAADRPELEEYLASGWLTLPASVGESNHDRNGTMSLGFVSSKREGTIQNDNLPEPAFLHVMKMPTLAKDSHFIANGFANGWIIDPEKVCKESNTCVRRADGTFTMDLVLEFVPQRVFYIGGTITLIGYAALLLAGVYYVINIVVLRKRVLI